MLLSPVGLLQLPSNRTEKETLDVSEHELQISCEIQDADKHLSNQGVLKEIEGYLLHSYLMLFKCPCSTPISNLPTQVRIKLSLPHHTVLPEQF